MRLTHAILPLILCVLLISCGGESRQAQQDYQLGMRLINGAGIAQDQTKGVEMLTRAADAGSADAQLALGFMLMKGEGVPKDAAKGLAYFEQAAKNGNVDAQYNAGLAYVRDEATAIDLSKAYEWFEMAALQGDSGAQYNLGVMLLNGEGVERNPLQAYAWFILAERGGNTGAIDGIRASKELLPDDNAGDLLRAVSALEKNVRKASVDRGAGAAETIKSPETDTTGVQEITVPL
ncbi:MAG: tetratricopeptide repeat protein [Candidatus Peribacteraceae bacterium]|nr:tetratricopeptide repeat protein [Candidatus Peribacteraceae bacterium]